MRHSAEAPPRRYDDTLMLGVPVDVSFGWIFRRRGQNGFGTSGAFSAPHGL
jgi:hypothetical protein